VVAHPAVVFVNVKLGAATRSWGAACRGCCHAAGWSTGDDKDIGDMFVLGTGCRWLDVQHNRVERLSEGEAQSLQKLRARIVE